MRFRAPVGPIVLFNLHLIIIWFQGSSQSSSGSSMRSDRKPRSEIKAKKADEINQARKKAHVRDRTAGQADILLQEGNFVLRNWVFVGNVSGHATTIESNSRNDLFSPKLLPSTTEAWLNELFSAFGKITRVVMRCSGGVVHTSGPLREPTRRDHHYASIEFDTRSASRLALNANGKYVRDATGRADQKLVVRPM